MCDLTEVEYLPGAIVWVKLGNCWWPGEVKDTESLPEDMVRDFKKKPLAIVKFFGEDSYEYVKNLDHIYHYNSRRKMEFIKKGMDLYRSKSKQGSTSLMTKFPTDVVTAESLSGGNVNILNSEAFVPEEKVNYRDIFESPKKKAKKSAEKQSGLKSAEKATSSPRASAAMAKANHIIQIKQRITHPRFVKESDHEIRIRQQPVASNEAEEYQHAYKCQECTFGTNRQNLFILHCKSHRDQEKLGVKPSTSTSTKSTAKNSTPKVRRSATPKATSTPKVAPAATKAATPVAKKTEKKEKSSPSKESAVLVRKIFQAPKKGKRGAPKKFPPKTEEEIAKEREKRNKILADWDEDEQEEEIEIKKLKLDTSGTETPADEPSEMEQDDKNVEEEEKEEKEGEEEKNEEKEEEKEEVAPTEEEEEQKSDVEPKEPEKKEEDPAAKDAASVYDIIEEPEAIAPQPARESKEKEDLAKEKEKLSKDVEDLLKETVVPSLPELPSLPNIPMKKSEPESVKEQSKDEVEENEAPAAAQSSPPEAKVAESAKTNGAATATTEEAVTVSPSEEAADANTETATYVLVTVDEGGFHQLSGLDGMATTLYIDPSQLTGSGTSLDSLYLAIDDGSIAQLDQQQVALQVGAEMAKTTQQDILAAALANTQVLQTTAVEATTQEAVVKVTNTTQAPVMTPRVTESTTSAVAQSNGAAGNSTS